MANVNPITGIKYGFELMAYGVAVWLIAILVMGAGIALADGGSTIAGGIVALIGFLAFFAGLFGMSYKLIADGVEKGVNASKVAISSSRSSSEDQE